MKKIIFVSIALFFCINIFAQKTDSQQISQLVENKNFRINILNVYHKNNSPIQVYSPHFLEIKDGRIVADFPYFVRKDRPTEISADNVALNSEILKYKAKHNAKKGYWLLTFVAKSKKGAEYKLLVVVQPNGYCVIDLTSPNKTTVRYDGRIKE
ncbi:MAG: DUF4251 domain-containing protein [Prevotellaceae bacterium]|jgi:hypothetical protein|nr:DUF4251 domain-containing protein [Prevotellaceae bacterium]